MSSQPTEPLKKPYGFNGGGLKAPALSKNILFIAAGIGLLSLAIVAGGKTVQPGNIGVKIRTLGPQSGVDVEGLTSGWHYNLLGERIVEFPVIQRTYAFTKEPDDNSNRNEELTFADNTGLPMSADMAVTIQVQPAAAPKLFQKYRLTFDQLLLGPIRNDVRSAIAAETEKVPVEVLYSGGRQAVISRALSRVSSRWTHEGVTISQMEWIGSIRYPPSILEQMQNKTKLEQQALAAKSLAAKAEAEAAAKIATARGEAESIRIINEALARNPQYVQLKAIERWDGRLPQVTSGTVPFLNISPKTTNSDKQAQ